MLSPHNLTLAEERVILASPYARRLIHEVLALAESRDPVDAAADALTAASILAARLARMQAEDAHEDREARRVLGEELPEPRATYGPPLPAKLRPRMLGDTDPGDGNW